MQYVVMDADEQHRADAILQGIKSADWRAVVSAVDIVWGPEGEVEEWFFYFCKLIAAAEASYEFVFFQTPDKSRVYKQIVKISADRNEDVIFTWMSDIVGSARQFTMFFPSGPLDLDETSQ